MNKKALLVIALTIAAAVMAADAPPIKVPSDIGIRIKNVQLDQARVQAQMLQLQVQYNTDQSTLTNDTNELNKLNKEALDTASLDEKKFTVDDEKLEFVAVPEKTPEVKK
jgi:hypothetical protein